MTRITYLFDPLCGWCYGASATIKALGAQPELTVELLPTGLFSNASAPLMNDDFAAYAWANDRRIAKLTGQPFSDTYRDKVLTDQATRFDSGPATLALTAVALTEPAQEIAALRAIQTARYVDGRDITDSSVLAQILADLPLAEAAERLAAADPELLTANRARISRAKALIGRLGVDGVPALVVNDGHGERLIRGAGIFANPNLAAKLAAAPAAV
ncbi:DsbA family protein [Paracoccus suum]|uniref:DsbA family protein n=1 Tax=Paracoccus suum TaxID=2259340 RepID=A0A344PM68_9RHOB|nr:DsbA family protein [Paracoccus suum]AXC50473.1 DsbA family protein [Paracoccus suum]